MDGHTKPQPVHIMYRFSEEEIQAMKDKLPELLQCQAETQEKRKEILDSFKDTIKGQSDEVKKIIRALRFGQEEREIVCTLVPNYLTMEMEYFSEGRADPVAVRPLTHAERLQPELTFIPKSLLEA